MDCKSSIPRHVEIVRSADMEGLKHRPSYTLINLYDLEQRKVSKKFLFPSLMKLKRCVNQCLAFLKQESVFFNFRRPSHTVTILGLEPLGISDT